MEEYAPGYAFSDTELVGLFGNENFKAGIEMPIAYHKPSGRYFCGYLKPGKKLPPVYPGIGQGERYPDPKEVKRVNERDPSMGMWTRNPCLSFQHAYGFHVMNEAAEFVQSNVSGNIFEGARHVDSEMHRDIFIGFSTYGEIKALFARWYKYCIPALDEELRKHFNGHASRSVEMSKYIFSLRDRDAPKDIVLRSLLARDADDKLVEDWWHHLAKQPEQPAEYIRVEMEHLKERIIRN